jgi:hypothetical protein
MADAVQRWIEYRESAPGAADGGMTNKTPLRLSVSAATLGVRRFE